MTPSLPTDARDLARRTALGVTTAIALLLAATALVDALALDVGGSGARNPFAAPPLLGSAIAAGVGAAVAYAALDARTDDPARYFALVAAAVFVLMLVPVAVIAPEFGVTTLGQVALAVLHALVAVPLVAFVLGWLAV